MGFSIVHTRAQIGVTAPAVAVEVDIAAGMPASTIVGLPETAVRESRDRVRSAIVNSGFDYPSAGRLTVNLAPADLPKYGSRYDLAIALAILAAHEGQLDPARLAGFEFIGELALNGELRPVSGALPVALACRSEKRTLVLPTRNAEEAARIPGVSLIPARDLLSVCAHLHGSCLIDTQPMLAPQVAPECGDLASVRGQERAKRALAIAAAGRHNLLMSGPPGTGKTMLATRLPGILPALDAEEALEVAAVHSVAGTRLPALPSVQPPFRAPHHSASGVALVGGGSLPRPGEITLAHRGVLFLDELPEWPRRHLELLREPLESGEIVIARALRRVHFPARFQLVAAMNPCPCGYLGSGFRECRCTPDQVQRYRDRISGPLLDRFDLLIEVSRPGEALFDTAPVPSRETNATIRERVCAARERQIRRQGAPNSELHDELLERVVALSASNREITVQAVKRWGLSARAYHRVLRLSRTIADFEGSAEVLAEHIGEALSYRIPEAAA